MTHSVETSGEEQINYLATKVMGWREMNGSWPNGKTKFRCFDPLCKQFILLGRDWNPLTDWNHWRQVEEKVMEDEHLFKMYIFDIDIGKGSTGIVACNVIKADLPTRVSALISAHKAIARDKALVAAEDPNEWDEKEDKEEVSDGTDEVHDV